MIKQFIKYKTVIVSVSTIISFFTHAYVQATDGGLPEERKGSQSTPSQNKNKEKEREKEGDGQGKMPKKEEELAEILQRQPSYTKFRSPNLPPEIINQILEMIYEPEDYSNLKVVNTEFKNILEEILEKEQKSYEEKPSTFTEANRQWRLAWYTARAHPQQSLELLKKAAYQHQLSAMTRLGYKYLHGDNVSKEPDLAFDQYLLPAAEQKHPQAQYVVGTIYEWGTEKLQKKDREKAKEWYEKAAKQGHAKSMLRLGYHYEGNIKVVHFNLRGSRGNKEKVKDENEELAEKYFYLAAKKAYYYQSELLGEVHRELSHMKSPEAAFLTAKVYELLSKGEDAYKNWAIEKYKKAGKAGHTQALEVIQSRAELGDPSYQCAYAELFLEEKRYEEGLKWLNIAAHNNYGQAYYILGQVYENGEYGIERDLEEALDLYYKAWQTNSVPGREAAQRIYEIAGMGRDEGDKKAQFLRGKIYELEKEYRHAKSFYEKSSNQDYLEASEALGILYADSHSDKEQRGINRSAYSAKKYLKGPAEKDFPAAQYFLGRVYMEGGEGVEKDIPNALKLFEKAAENKHPRALLFMGRFHEKGEHDLEPNKDKALELYKEAARFGDKKALYHAGRLILEVNPTDEEGKSLIEKSCEKGKRIKQYDGLISHVELSHLEGALMSLRKKLQEKTKESVEEAAKEFEKWYPHYSLKDYWEHTSFSGPIVKSAKRLSIDKWPHQSWKQALGSWLFFPQELEDLYDPTISIYGRSYNQYSLAYSAYYRNPLAYYHLSKLVESYNLSEEDEEDSMVKLEGYFYQKAVTYLESVRTYEDNKIETEPFEYARGLLEKYLGESDGKSWFKQGHKRGDPRATYYLALSSDEKEKKINLYKQANKRGCKKALLKIASNSTNPQVAFNKYAKAGKKGIAEGYYHTGNMILNKGFRLLPLEGEAVKKEHEYLGFRSLRIAGEDGMLTAFDTAARYALKVGKVELAKRLYVEKGDNGDAKGYCDAGVLALRNKKVERIEEAKKYYLKAQKLGDMLSQFKIAELEDVQEEKSKLSDEADRLYQDRFEELMKITQSESREN